MKRFIISAIMAIFSTAAMAQTFPDTLKKVVAGKVISFPVEYRSEDYVAYSTCEPFVEHDTTFIYRAYEYSLKKDGTYRCDPASYFIVSRKQKEWNNTLERMGSRKDLLKSNEMPTLALIEENTGVSLHDKFIVEPVGKPTDMPRLLYPLLKYDGSYYFSDDNPYLMEFFGNLLLHYGQEWWCEELIDFKQLPDGGWSYTEIWDKEIAKTSLVPCSQLQGTYIMTLTYLNGIEKKSLWTDHQHIHNFDIIGWTGPHVNVGYKCYDEIDFDALK